MLRLHSFILSAVYPLEKRHREFEQRAFTVVFAAGLVYLF